MKVELRIKQVLDEYGIRRHGVVAEMVVKTGYHRHSLTKLLNNEVKNPSLDMIGAVCDCLINKGVPAEILPGALFGSRPNGLWNAITQLGRITLYVGELQQAHKRWIAASDHQAENTLVEYLSRGDVVTPEVSTRYIPFRLPEAPNKRSPAQKKDEQRALEVLQALEADSNRSAILIGAQRTNYLAETLMGGLIGRKPFVPTKSIVPVYLKHGKTDCVAPSCFGGKVNPPRCKAVNVPKGVFYRTKDGWKACPWEDKKRESGVVIIERDLGTQRVVISMFGVTGWGTQAIARALLKENFWRPEACALHKGREVAIFVCEFTFRATEGATCAPETEEFTVTPIDKEVLAKFIH